jgi:hypothetical protein
MVDVLLDEIQSYAFEDLLSKTPAHGMTQSDNDGNFPFFMAARAGLVEETFLMVRMGASQGLFEKVRRPRRSPGGHNGGISDLRKKRKYDSVANPPRR